MNEWMNERVSKTYNVSVSFQTGFKHALMVFVFFLTLSVSGMSFILTYGSLKPFGSIGIKFLPSLTTFYKISTRIEKKLWKSGWILSIRLCVRAGVNGSHKNYLQCWVGFLCMILLNEYAHVVLYDHNRISLEHFPRIVYERSCHMLIRHSHTGFIQITKWKTI